MIKFFRKIRYNLMEQNKTGKYLKYAIGEIVLVMVGILLALQINNWNEGQKIIKWEHRFLTDLKSELENNLIQLERIDKNQKLVGSACIELKSLIEIAT